MGIENIKIAIFLIKLWLMWFVSLGMIKMDLMIGWFHLLVTNYFSKKKITPNHPFCDFTYYTLQGQLYLLKIFIFSRRIKYYQLPFTTFNFLVIYQNFTNLLHSLHIIKHTHKLLPSICLFKWKGGWKQAIISKGIYKSYLKIYKSKHKHYYS